MTTLTIKLTEKIKKRRRKFGLMAMDLFFFLSSYWLTWFISVQRISMSDHFGIISIHRAEMAQYYGIILYGCLCFVLSLFFSFFIFRMYESLWRYADFTEYLDCILAVTVGGLTFFAMTKVWFHFLDTEMSIPLFVYFLATLITGTTTLSSRMCYRAYRTALLGKTSAGAKKVMVVGAGDAGCGIIKELASDPNQNYDVICAVDDAVHLRGCHIQRVKVEGTTKHIPTLAKKYGIDIIIIAIPSATNDAMRRISKICAETKCTVKKIPALLEFVAGNPAIAQIQDIKIEDLLGRSIIDVDTDNINFLAGKTVLVTGAGGSIGSELCRQAAVRGAERLVMVDISENGLYEIQQELLRKYRSTFTMHAEVASVRDERKLDLIFGRYKPDIIYHAAAHKHVPLMEDAPEEAVKNNIFGTLKTMRCADKHGVKRFVMISTDKAVNPTNIMGTTKRVCEMLIQAMNEVSKTEFVAVRFGNVLGSNGSVIPLFKKQIAEGGPVTVTDARITRYFMTIPEAVGLVMAAGEMANGGEIFVLDMGEPVKIIDLAKDMIKMSGYEPYDDIDIEITGLRPGEKLYEELLINNTLSKTLNNKIFIDEPINIFCNLFEYLSDMKTLADCNDTAGLMDRLHTLVPEFVTEKEKAKQYDKMPIAS